MVRRKHDRIGDEAVFVPFNGAHHGSLRRWRLVVMHDTDTAQECETDGHLRFSDGIHWTTQKRCLQDDVASDLGIRDDVGCWKVDLSWKHQEIIVSETTLNLGVHELLDGEPIESGIGLQVSDGFGRIKKLFGWGGHFSQLKGKFSGTFYMLYFGRRLNLLSTEQVGRDNKTRPRFAEFKISDKIRCQPLRQPPR